ncbi:MAG: response regulator [Pseudomonadaceae bacterium]|nr:response regulator [Pseudomonadaceae bacterium]
MTAHRQSAAFAQLLVLLALSVIALPTQANPISDIDFLVAPSEAFDLDDARASRAWQPMPESRSLGYIPEPVWLRFDVPRGTDAVTLNNMWLKDLTIYLLAGEEVVTQYRTGAEFPFASRPLDNALLSFPIDQSAGINHVVIRDVSDTGQFYPIAAQTWPEYHSSTSRHYLFAGFYIGLMLLVLAYNTAIYVSTREKLNLYFAGYISSLTIFLLTSDGLGQQFLWPEWPSANNILVSLSIAGTAAFLLAFVREFLSLKQAAPIFLLPIRIIIVVVLANSVVALLTDWQLPSLLEPTLSLATVIFVLVIGLHRLRAGDPYAPILLIANGTLLLGVCAVSLLVLGFASDSWLTRNAVRLGSIIEVILLSAAIATRVRSMVSSQNRLEHRARQLGRRVQELRAAKQLAAEHQEIQRSLQQSQKLRTIGEMTAGLAHDFNNVFASILGFSELGRERANKAGDTKARGYFDEVYRAGSRGADLIRQLSLYSQGGRETVAEIDVETAVNDAANLLRGTLPPSVTIEVSGPESPHSIVINAAQLQQLLVNVALNACEAMANRGTLTISCDIYDVREQQCSSCLSSFHGPMLKIQIEDQGPGFSGNPSELFTPFFTTKTVGEGSGLGLSVVHGITHEYGGHVHLSNRAQGGGRVSVFLPVSEEYVTHAADPARQPHILLIEDDASVRRYLNTLLAAEQFQVTSLALATEALERFAREPSAFDLVITDQLMAVGSGLELAQDMLAIRPDLPIIIATGNPEGLSDADIVRSGIKAVFAKPLDRERLITKVRALLPRLSGTSS